jgi:hypothetical protein
LRKMIIGLISWAMVLTPHPKLTITSLGLKRYTLFLNGSRESPVSKSIRFSFGCYSKIDSIPGGYLRGKICS